MRGGRDGDWHGHGVYAGRHAARVDGREFCRESRADRRARVEKGAVAARDAAEHAARNNVAGREFGGWVDVGEKAMAVPVDDQRALAAQRFRRERRGIDADVDGGRVKLHEFGVGDQRAGARRHGDAGAAGVDGVCRDAIEMADAAGREHKRGAAEEARLSVGVAAKHADRPAFPRYDLERGNTLDDFDRRRRPAPVAPALSMIARPAASPFTRTMRRCVCAASREGCNTPSASRSKGAP